MDRFVKRGKRKSSPDSFTQKPETSISSHTTTSSSLNEHHNEDDENEPTDVKLAKLTSVHPDLDQHLLLDFLLAHNGSVNATLESIKFSSRDHHSKPSSKITTVKAQTSLRSFAIPTTKDSQTPSQQQQQQRNKKPKLLSRKGATLHLYDPEDIAQHTPCTVIHNFLPEDEANDLLRELLQESKTFQKITFKLFDNVVSSPHTSGFYVATDYELNDQKSEYVYNGARIEDVRRLTPLLEKIKPRVQEAVNREIQERIRTVYGGKKLKYQSPDPWRPNAAFVNCYNGPEENVGWHSDQLTYLGPRAVIGSLSLGVTREFRVRRILPQESSSSSATHSDLDPDLSGQISLPLPHNSLLVMHANMQESWKHSVSPARTISPHPISGNARINITYRDYKQEFHPRYTPRCKCNVPTVLRVVQKKNNENLGRYFWMCHAGNVPGKEGCSFFKWAEFDDDGRPLGHTVGGTSKTIKSAEEMEEER